MSSTSYSSAFHPMTNANAPYQSNTRVVWNGNYPSNSMVSQQTSAYYPQPHITLPTNLGPPPITEDTVASQYNSSRFNMNNFFNNTQSGMGNMSDIQLYNNTTPQSLGSRVIDSSYNPYLNYNSIPNNSSMEIYSTPPPTYTNTVFNFNSEPSSHISQMPMDYNSAYSSGNSLVGFNQMYQSPSNSGHSTPPSYNSSPKNFNFNSAPPSFSASPLDLSSNYTPLPSNPSSDLGSTVHGSQLKNFFDFILRLPLLPIPSSSSPEQNNFKGRNAGFKDQAIKPKARNQRLNLVLPTPESRIHCKWDNCSALIYPSVQALEVHMSQHAGVADACNNDRLTCRWVHKNVVCHDKIFKTSLSKHLGTHFHGEGQPSPFVAQSACCEKIYVARGSSKKHFRFCHN